MSHKTTLEISYESKSNQKKLKRLEFSVKVIIKEMPIDAKALEELLIKNTSLDVLELSLKEIMIHNENISEYMRLYNGDKESTETLLVPSIKFHFYDGGISTSKTVELETGSFKPASSVSNLLDTIYTKIIDSNKLPESRV